ncbi:hypothetical protein HOU03_gp292 [Caulobacter phage CcrSC]|uniref:Uncharacterized protein n=1 Tax=Caulobacter phage CcrSC TaxID=2283272 RepID=A0A385EE81_9CAUD|nr:hypothetical protein HOU03_gp292 [Caulobacter phage CcrSC]AXQ69976.1 hypothetical protein CcrSC_gp394 [Caulobacter phage CcrSC]
MAEPYLAPLNEENLALVVKALERYGMDCRAEVFNESLSLADRAAASARADKARDLRMDLMNRTVTP